MGKVQEINLVLETSYIDMRPFVVYVLLDAM